MNYDESRALELFSSRGGKRQPGQHTSTTRDVPESPAPARLLPAQSLAAREMLAINDGVATTLRIDSGEVWITEEGSLIDHILCAGQQHTLDRPGRAIVEAQTASRVSLYAPSIDVPPRSVERRDPRRAVNRLVYARSLWLDFVASLVSLWARRPALAR